MARRKMDDREPAAAGAGADARAELSIAGATGETRGVALVLHGGRADSYESVRGTHLSPARMLPFARALRRPGGRDGLAVWTLRNRYRGWNGKDMSPVAGCPLGPLPHQPRTSGGPRLSPRPLDGRPDRPLVADHPQVEAVVTLAPWLNGETPVSRVAGRRLLIVHGTDDRWTSPANSLAYARRADGVAESVDYVALKGAGHFIFRRVSLWNSLATGFILDAFAGSSGRNVQGRADTFRSLLPAAGASLPVVL